MDKFCQNPYCENEGSKEVAVSVKSPGDADAYYKRGVLHAEIGLYDLAVKDFTKAVELKPDFAEAYDGRGFAYIGKGLYDLAIKDCTKAIELKPDYTDAYYNRGLAYYEKGLYDLAVKDCTKTIELEPDFAQAYYITGHVLGSFQLEAAIAVTTGNASPPVEPLSRTTANFPPARHTRKSGFARVKTTPEMRHHTVEER